MAVVQGEGAVRYFTPDHPDLPRHFRVRFPEPEADERAQLWQKLLPPETGLHAAVDFAALAHKFEMTGGYIKNAVVRAPNELWQALPARAKSNLVAALKRRRALALLVGAVVALRSLRDEMASFARFRNSLVIVSLVIMGISSITAQILLMRELLVSFLGNELTLGIILANWMVLEAAGAFLLGKSAERVKRKIEVYVVLPAVE